jgi:hypothetical protein
LLRVSDAQGNIGTAAYRVVVVTAHGPGPGPPGGNATGPEPTGGLPVVALAALVAGGVAGGLALGVVVGRRTRRPPEGEA